MAAYDPRDCFFFVAGDESRAWSSAREAWVTDWDRTRQSVIGNARNIRDVLRPYGLRGPQADHPDARDVRDECMRRLVVLVGASDSESTAFRVANFTRRLVRLLCKGKLTDSERVEASAILAVDQQIEALHEASSRLESAPPADYMADVHWTIPKGQGGTIAEGQDQLDISPLLAMFQEVTAATIVSNMSDIAARCSSPDETVANACRVVMDRDAARTGQTRDQRISYWLNAHASAVMATAEAVLARPA